jgi:GDP-L-fucose synthase
MTGKLEPTNSPYAMAKLSAIEIGDAIFQEYGHSITNLMPTNLYGPHDHFSENDSHVIPGMIHKMHIAKKENKESFDIWGSGNPLREFLYVDDLSLAIKKIIEERPEDPLINIGSGEEISISELAHMVKEVIGYQGELKFDKSMPDGNPRKLLNSEIIKSLGWSPEYKLQEGLNLTYEWYLNNN